jgi:hypothetical protein
MLAGDTSDRQTAPLPEIVVVDLGHGGTKAVLELRLCGLDVLALALQGPGFGKVQLDGQDADVACGHLGILDDRDAAAEDLRRVVIFQIVGSIVGLAFIVGVMVCGR